MTGLILKDLLNLKKQLKIYIIYIIFYCILFYSSDNFGMLSGMIIMFAVMIPITAMGYDEKDKWDIYALTMPVSRNELVLSKYVVGLIFLFSSFIITLFLGLLYDRSMFKENILISLVVLSAGMILIAVLFPIFFKYGVEKGRTFMMLILFIPIAALIFASKLGFKLHGVEESELIAFFHWLPIISVAVLAVSVLISISIYRRKEF
jgi:putative exporter of polyketide antibiotics